MTSPMPSQVVPDHMLPIPGHVGYYATADGKIYSTLRPKYHRTDYAPREKAQITSKMGYKTVCLANGKRVGNLLAVHRLIALTFYGPPVDTEHSDVDHIDGNPGNNSYWNLRWVSHTENMHYAQERFGGHAWNRGEGYSKAALTDAMVSYIRGSNKTTKDLAMELGVNYNTLASARDGHSWRHVPMGGR